MPPPMKRSQGFTLIEIAVVLIIITLISGGLISFFGYPYFAVDFPVL